MSELINPFLLLDVYKMGHCPLYKPGTTKIYSYGIARSNKKYSKSIFFGLQYYLSKYLSIKPENWMVDEFIEYHTEILGFPPEEDFKKRLYSIVELGYFPIEIKALEEGTEIPIKNVLFTIKNTHPDHFWMTGFFETLLLMVWNTCTVASYSRKYLNLCKDYAYKTCDNEDHLPFQVHDFGMRGCSSVETASLSGAAHLINFFGSDTVPAKRLLKHYYSNPTMLSVVATEHSIMQSWGKDGELDGFRHIINKNPGRIVSIVSDTYDFFNIMTKGCDSLKEEILSREGKVVFRPDSGNPEHIICGDPNAPNGSNERQGALELLWDRFGGTMNEKGYRILNPKVGLIYGDSMFFERFERTLQTMKENGFASSNLVIGVGGLLLQQHNRDDQGYAIKATYAEINGVPHNLLKDPITDPGKKSHTGLLMLDQTIGPNGKQGFFTHDQCTWEEEKEGLLKTVFLNGKVVKKFTLEEVRNNSNKG